MSEAQLTSTYSFVLLWMSRIAMELSENILVCEKLICIFRGDTVSVVQLWNKHNICCQTEAAMIGWICDRWNVPSWRWGSWNRRSQNPAGRTAAESWMTNHSERRILDWLLLSRPHSGSEKHSGSSWEILRDMKVRHGGHALHVTETLWDVIDVTAATGPLGHRQTQSEIKRV